MKNIKSFNKFVNEGKLSFLSKKEGTEITNPFYDTTGRFTNDDPEKEYGPDYKKSDMKKFVDANEVIINASWKLKEIYNHWKDSGPEEDIAETALKFEMKHIKDIKEACEALLKL